MTALWRHANGDGWPLEPDCAQCYADQWETEHPVICDTPTPDPSSPCAMCWKPLANAWHPQNADPWSHDFIAMKGEPTRCTCGHPIEAAS